VTYSQNGGQTNPLLVSLLLLIWNDFRESFTWKCLADPIEF